MQTHTRIKLKLGTQNGRIKRNLCTNFSKNLVKISGVMTKSSRKTRSICCHAYRVNCSKDLVKTWHVDGVNIVGVPFCGLKRIGKKHRDMIQNPTGIKMMQSNLQIKNPHSYTATIQSSKLKIDL